MTLILSILVLTSSVALIGLVLISEPVDNNMSALTGGGASDTFWGSNKGNSKEAMINKVTVIAAVVLAVSLILLLKF